MELHDGDQLASYTARASRRGLTPGCPLIESGDLPLPRSGGVADGVLMKEPGKCSCVE